MFGFLDRSVRFLSDSLSHGSLSKPFYIQSAIQVQRKQGSSHKSSWFGIYASCQGFQGKKFVEIKCCHMEVSHVWSLNPSSLDIVSSRSLKMSLKDLRINIMQKIKEYPFIFPRLEWVIFQNQPQNALLILNFSVLLSFAESFVVSQNSSIRFTSIHITENFAHFTFSCVLFFNLKKKYQR